MTQEQLQHIRPQLYYNRFKNKVITKPMQWHQFTKRQVGNDATPATMWKQWHENF